MQTLVPPKHSQPVQGTKTKQSLPEALSISQQEDHNLRQKKTHNNAWCI